MRTGNRVILDAPRFAQVGTWSGHAARRRRPTSRSTPTRWVGARDRSWGIRPVGEPDAAGPARRGADRGLLVAVRPAALRRLRAHRHRAGGTRRLPHAQRRDAGVAPTGASSSWAGRAIEIDYRSGTRHPERARYAPDHARRQAARSSRSRRSDCVALHVGAGYGGDPDWTHGQWMGRGWSSGRPLRPDRPGDRRAAAVRRHRPRRPGRAATGQEGWGLFEHASLGRHDPTGFADWTSRRPLILRQAGETVTVTDVAPNLCARRSTGAFGADVARRRR